MMKMYLQKKYFRRRRNINLRIYDSFFLKSTLISIIWYSQRAFPQIIFLRWEFIKRKQENTFSTKKAIKKERKNDNGQEKMKENTLSTKKPTKKKGKKILIVFLVERVSSLFSFFSYLPVFFYKLSPLMWT